MPRTNQHVRHCHAARSAPPTHRPPATTAKPTATPHEPAAHQPRRSERTGAVPSNPIPATGDRREQGVDLPVGRRRPMLEHRRRHRARCQNQMLMLLTEEPQTHESAQTGAAVLHRGRQATPQPLLIQNEHTETGSAPIAFRSCSRSSCRQCYRSEPSRSESSSPSDAVKKKRTRQITSKTPVGGTSPPANPSEKQSVTWRPASRWCTGRGAASHSVLRRDYSRSSRRPCCGVASNSRESRETYAHLWPDADDRTRKAAADLLNQALGAAADGRPENRL